MLNSMFKEFQAILGDEYALFQEFNPKLWKNKEILDKYKNIGVLYVTNGNLNKLPDGAMMEISYVLELFMRVEESYNTSAPVVLPLENLATGTTGKIYTDRNNQSYNYILNVGLPTSDGSLEPAGDYDYIRYELPISVVFTNRIALSDNTSITLKIDGETFPKLRHVLSFVEAPQTQLETDTFLDELTTGSVTYPEMQNESAVVATSWNAQIVKLYDPYDRVDVALRKLILDTPDKQITITYRNGSDEQNARVRQVILHDCTFSNELGQAVVMMINMSTAMRKV